MTASAKPKSPTQRERARSVSLPPSGPDDVFGDVPVASPAENATRPPMIGSRTDRGEQPTRTYTGVGAVMEAIGAGRALSTKLAETEARLQEFDGAIVVRSLDPKAIQRSRWASRDCLEFETKEFADFKAEIANSGGNVQPIKVRPLPRGSDGEYEIAFGHRRHQACLELGLRVNAMIEELSDLDLFSSMVRENRTRRNLSPFEQGQRYELALKDGLYPSLRRLAQDLGVDQSNAGKELQLAALPHLVIEAFASPLQLQHRWAAPLTEAVRRDPDGVLARARAVATLEKKPSAARVVELLLGGPDGGGLEPLGLHNLEEVRRRCSADDNEDAAAA